MKTKEIYNGNYVVYEDGRVWSNKRNKFMRGGYCGRNRSYRFVNLSVNGKPKPFLVHRLVAECFIPNPENKPEVNHIDGNPHNNSLDNLEWCTRQENCQHAFDIGLMDNLLKTKKCKCGEMISPRMEMCAKCRAEQGRIKKHQRHIAERNKEADLLKRFCRTAQDKRFIYLWRTGMTLQQIGEFMGMTRQAVDEKHKTLKGRLDKYYECLAIING